MTRTFIDSGVLIVAARGEGAIAERALASMNRCVMDCLLSLADHFRHLPVGKPIG